jgi:hypothetical protein
VSRDFSFFAQCCAVIGLQHKNFFSLNLHTVTRFDAVSAFVTVTRLPPPHTLCNGGQPPLNHAALFDNIGFSQFGLEIEMKMSGAGRRLKRPVAANRL